MDNDEALILLAASLRNQVDTLERFIKFVERYREAEELRKENAELRKKGEGARRSKQMTRDNVEEFFNNMLDELLELLYDIKCWAKATKKCCRVLICGGLIGQVSETVNS